ncbi:MAG TPA: D-tyrosyl-tRNA(Tyr) deacylase [Bacteroidetes bacterium]|nr:D-tyrosyl-tRNA(Tyr) deacylase [Bacteroidota bacterium]
MRLVIQRVSEASLTVDGQSAGNMKAGLVVLIGIEEADTEEDATWLAGKVSAMRIFGDNDGKMNLSLTDIAGSLMVVSQFTLHASTKKGNRPSFIKAARPEKAIPLYDSFIARIRNLLPLPAVAPAKEGKTPIITGTFGADMQVQLVNDGPVTIIIDSKERQ